MCVLIRRFAGRQKIYTCVSCHRPVVVFTTSIYACKRLFMKQAHKTVTCSYLLHDFHCELVMVGCNICSCINWRELMLCRCNLIMLSLCKDSELPEFFIEFRHICFYSRLDYTEVMVIHFLTFRRFCTKECSACINQILTLFKHFLGNKEIFLFRTDRSMHILSLCTKKLQNTKCLLI